MRTLQPIKQALLSTAGLALWACAVFGAHAQLPTLAEQRTAFVELEKTMLSERVAELPQYNDAIVALKDYPLYGYLVATRLSRSLSIRNRDAVETFLAQFGDQPVSWKVRADWLKYLGEKGHREAFMASYKAGYGAEITCYYLDYQLHSEANPEPFLNQIKPLWLAAESQPKSCDRVFKRWQQYGRMTPDMVLERMRLVAQSGSTRMLPYLQRRLPEEQRYLADLWRRVRGNPRATTYSTAFPLRNPDEEAHILAYGLSRLAWADPDATARAYQRWSNKLTFSKAQRLRITRTIALSYALDNDPKAPEWLEIADEPGAQEDVARWHLANRIRQRDFEGALAVIHGAVGTQQNSEQFRYWRARSYAELGDVQTAQPLFNELAAERSYYGFLASAQLGIAPNLGHAPSTVTQAALEQIKNLPAAQRAQELFQLERWIDARREWREMNSNLSQEQRQLAALVASEWGWHDQAIIGFAQSGQLDDVERRFPLAFQPAFERVSQQYSIDPAFALAIARRESSFMVDAVSPAGARGLMQVLPDTARYLARKRLSSSVLFEPEQNLEFGVQYLRYLMDKLGEHPVLVTASYNAGWQKVLDWLPTDGPLALDIWIENIPYRETRQYVKAVLTYRAIYQWQMGYDKPLFDALSNMQITADYLTLTP